MSAYKYIQILILEYMDNSSDEDTFVGGNGNAYGKPNTHVHKLYTHIFVWEYFQVRKCHFRKVH